MKTIIDNKCPSCEDKSVFIIREIQRVQEEIVNKRVTSRRNILLNNDSENRAVEEMKIIYQL